MNQILLTNTNKFIKKDKNIKKFKIIFIISIIFLLISFSYFLYTCLISNIQYNLSLTLLNTFNIERLYLNTDNNKIYLNNNNYLVIGSIEIPSINVNYPLLSDINDDLLKIAPCKFYGPYPNKVGNLCIAAHNYNDNRFFSNLFKLNYGDIINIYDSSSKLVTYYVYDKYEVSESDISCTSQNTNGRKELTLITCNNLNGNRLIVKAKE